MRWYDFKAFCLCYRLRFFDSFNIKQNFFSLIHVFCYLIFALYFLCGVSNTRNYCEYIIQIAIGDAILQIERVSWRYFEFERCVWDLGQSAFVMQFTRFTLLFNKITFALQCVRVSYTTNVRKWITYLLITYANGKWVFFYSKKFRLQIFVLITESTCNPFQMGKINQNASVSKLIFSSS